MTNVTALVWVSICRHSSHNYPKYANLNPNAKR